VLVLGSEVSASGEEPTCAASQVGSASIYGLNSLLVLCHLFLPLHPLIYCHISHILLQFLDLSNVFTFIIMAFFSSALFIFTEQIIVQTLSYTSAEGLC